MPVVTTFYVAPPKPLQSTANNQSVAAAAANACQTNASQQASGSSFSSGKFGSGFFDQLKASFPMANSSSSGSQASSTGSSNSNSILGGHFSSLTQQVLSSIHQQQSGQSGQSGQSSTPAVVCPPAVSPTPAATATPVNSDLSTTVSLGLVDQNKAKWDQAASSGNYSFSLTQRNANASSGTERPVNVTVSNGRISGASYNDNSAVGSDVLNGLQTIDQLFDSIRAAQSSGQRTDVLYDAQSGYPSFIFMGNDRATAADDTSYILSNVKLNG